jgi:uncharacterized membrane protein
MPTVEQSVDVKVTVTTAYRQWTLFESYPQWMEGVAAVERTGDAQLHWIAKVREEFATVEGETREWDARITEMTPDRRVSWESAGGRSGEKPNAGAATFAPLGDSSSRVTFRMQWEPEDGQETPSQVLDAVSQVVAADLGRFKDLIEAREPARACAEASAENPVSLTGNAKAALR